MRAKLTDTASLLDLSPTRAIVAATRHGFADSQRRHPAAETVALIVDPGRAAEEYDAPDPSLGFACGRGLGRRKES